MENQKKKICIIEDEESLRAACATKLENSGYDVFLASNGEAGIALVKDINPDLIILDLMMPLKNGFEVMEALQNDENFSKIPIIIFSNMDDVNSSEKAGEFETRFYLIKALTSLEKLLGIVREVLH